MDSNKIDIGQKKVKQLEAGIHTNMELLRKALNKIILDNGFETPEELEQLNSLFNQ